MAVLFAISSLPCAAAHGDTRSVPSELRFVDDFNNLESPTATGWTVVNETTTGGASSWSVRKGTTSGVLAQDAPTGGEGSAPAAKPGTYVVGGNAGWTTVDLQGRMKTTGDGSIGVLVRRASSTSWYRFAWNQKTGARTLVKRSGAAFTVLASDTAALERGRWYTVRVRAEDATISVFVDGVRIFTAADAAKIPAGRVGLYSWGAGPAYFDDIDVRATVNSFTIAVLPDTQYYAERASGIFEAQTRWIAAQRGNEKIAFVLHEGDLVGAACKTAQWAVASRAMKTLAGKVPYAIAPGNHDIIRYATDGCGVAGKPDKFVDRSFFNAAFPTSRLKADNPVTYGGHLAASDASNTFHRFEAAGKQYLVLAIQFGPRASTLDWAGGVIEANPGRDVLVVTHDYLSAKDTVRGTSWSAEHALASIGRNPTTGACVDASTCQQWGIHLRERLVKRYPLVRFVFGGHVVQCHDSTSKTALDPNGTCGSATKGVGWAGRLALRHPGCVGDCTTYQMLANYQGLLPNMGNGYLRLVRVAPAASTVVVQTYSPTLRRCLRDERNEFSWPAGVAPPATPCPP